MPETTVPPATSSVARVGLGAFGVLSEVTLQNHALRRVKKTVSPAGTVVLRPGQSEALFLQFGDIAVCDDGEIAELWPKLPVSA